MCSDLAFGPTISVTIISAHVLRLISCLADVTRREVQEIKNKKDVTHFNWFQLTTSQRLLVTEI